MTLPGPALLFLAAVAQDPDAERPSWPCCVASWPHPAGRVTRLYLAVDVASAGKEATCIAFPC
jgi:hypothetical protein